MTPVQARTRRRAAGLALSLAVHAALLAAFMSVTPRLLTLPRLPAPPEPVVELELSPRSSAPGSAPGSPHRVGAANPSPAAIPLRPPVQASLPALPAQPRSVSPSAAATLAAAPPARSPQGAADGRWRVRPGGDADLAARALVRGTIGCGAAEWRHLTADERDHCTAEVVRGMRTLRVDPLPAGKRAYYDEVVARTEAARDPATYDTLHQHENEPPGPHPVDVAVEARCFIRFGPGAARANRDDPCRARLPLSALTAETRASPPPTLADQIADDRAKAKLDALAPPR